MPSLSADLRDAVRALRHNPTFTTIAVLTIALGIGANTAVFSVLNAVLLRPLPYRDPGRLVWIAKIEPAMRAEIAAGADYLDWRDQSRTLGAVAAWDEAPGLTLLGGGDPERVTGAHVSASFLPLLGVSPARGRSFAADEERLNGPPVAIISHRLWERLFGPAQEIGTRSLRLDSGVFTIVGVLPPSFLFPQSPPPDVLLPLRLDEATERHREMMSILHVIGRLRRDATTPQVRSELTAIWRRGEQQARAGMEQRAGATPEGAGLPAARATSPSATVAGSPVAEHGPTPDGNVLVRPYGAPEGKPAQGDTFDVAVGAPSPGGANDGRPITPPVPPGALTGGAPAGAPNPGGGGRIQIRVDGPGGPGGPGSRGVVAGAGDIVVRSLQQHLVGDVRPALLLLMATVALVLLIACANVANLLLARATARARELAVRATLGATRWRLLRQLLVESVLLSVLGGALGVLLALWGLGVLRGILPPSLSQGALGLSAISIDRGVLAFTFAVAALTGVLFGAAPAFIASRLDLESCLKEASRSAAGSAGRSRLRRALVTGEIALAVVLLVGAGLLVRSFGRLLSVDPGFRPERVVTMAVELRTAFADAGGQRAESFFAGVAARARMLPGVQAVAYGDTVPLREYSRIMMGLGVEAGEEPETTGPPPEVAVSTISPEYFAAMGIRLIRGRMFTARDQEGAPPVAIVNERFARQFWGATDPVGKRFRFGPRRPDWITVVGVVADVRHEGLSTAARRTMYRPFAQDPVPFGFIVVRTTGDAVEMVQSVRQVVRGVDPSLAVFDVATMDQRVERSVGGRRFSMMLMLVFAGLALVLAGIGLYGVLAYTVGERTREIGIRMALGAEAGDVLALVMRQSGTMVLAGLALGLAGALAAGPLLSSALYAVTARDAVTLAGAPLLIAGMAVLATWWPARRATRVSPVEALREE